MTDPSSPTNRVVVLREHLQEIYSAVDWARTYHYAQDLSESARKGKSDSQQSRLTMNLDRAHQRLEGYLMPVSDDE